MKRLLITASALALLTAPAMAQSSKSGSDAAAQAAARASGGFNINHFEGSRIPKNTPDAIAYPGSVAGSDCQIPGFAFGLGLTGTGTSLSIPGGVDEECKALTMASFYAKLSNSVTDAGEARTYRQTSVALTCQVPRMRALPLCALATPAGAATYTPAPAPHATHAAVMPAAQQSYRPAYSYAQLQAQPWYCDNPAGYYPAVSLCSAWRQVPR